MTHNKPKMELKVAHLNHGGDEYSLSIEVNDTHVDLTTTPYPHRPGNTSNISIYRMTPDDILLLGNSITLEAFKAKGHLEAGNADKV